MNITSINPINLKNPSLNKNTSVDSVQVPFKSLLTDAMNNVKQTEQTLQEEVVKLATGESDDLHNITIASTKSALSLELMVQLRNKALDSYNEIMRMGV